MNKARRIVFVCTGNICRSAMAEHLLRHLAAKHGLALEAASAGTAAQSHFQVPQIARRLLTAEGVPPFEHTARLATGEVLRSADLILAMAAEHRDYVRQLYPDLAPRTRLLREAAGFGVQDLVDPMAKPDEEFARCLAAIRESLEAMIRSRFHDPRGVPALKDLGWRRLTPRLAPLYIPERQMGEAAAARLGGFESILAVGCGTSLGVAVKRARPGCRVAGVDGDPSVIRLARRKAEKLGLTLELRAADATELPFGGLAFDAAVVGIPLQSLGPERKRAAIREAARVLRPGGRLLVLDFRAGRLVPLIAEAGFSDAVEIWRRVTLLGPVRMLEARRMAVR